MELEGKFGGVGAAGRGEGGGKPGSSEKTYLLFSWNFHNFCFVCLSSFSASLSLSLLVLFLWFLLCEMVKSKQDAPRRSKNYYYSQQYSRYYMASKSPFLPLYVCVYLCVWDASIIFLTLFTFCIFIVASPCASCAAFVAFNQLRRVGQWEEGKGSRRGSSSRRRSRARQRSCLCWTTHKAAAAWMRAPDSKEQRKKRI